MFVWDIPQKLSIKSKLNIVMFFPRKLLCNLLSHLLGSKLQS